MNSRYGRFFQLGYVVKDINGAITGLQNRMGAEVIDLTHDCRDGKGKPRSIEKVAHLSIPGVELELVQPRPGFDSIYTDYVPTQVDGLSFHHIGYLLPDLESYEAVVADVEAAGIPIPLQNTFPSVRYIYADTRATTGHYSELVFRTPGFPTRPLP